MQAVDLIIFGASGDLSARKLFPALYQLDQAGLLQSDLRIAAIARDAIATETFLSKLRARMSEAMGDGAPDDASWAHYSARFTYINCDFSKVEEYANLRPCQFVLLRHAAEFVCADLRSSQQRQLPNRTHPCRARKTHRRKSRVIATGQCHIGSVL